MDTSKFLAKVIGIYFIVIGMVMLSNMSYFISNVILLIQNPSSLFTIGFFTTIIGILLIVSHSKWRLNWVLLITLISWAVFFKGVLLILHPEYIVRCWIHCVERVNYLYGCAAFMLLIGLLLCYKGYRSK